MISIYINSKNIGDNFEIIFKSWLPKIKRNHCIPTIRCSIINTSQSCFKLLSRDLIPHNPSFLHIEIDNQEKTYLYRELTRKPQCKNCGRKSWYSHKCNPYRCDYFQNQIIHNGKRKSDSLTPTSLHYVKTHQALNNIIKQREGVFFIYFDLESLSSETKQILFTYGCAFKMYKLNRELSKISSIIDNSENVTESIRNDIYPPKRNCNVQYLDGQCIIDDLDSDTNSEYRVLNVFLLMIEAIAKKKYNGNANLILCAFNGCNYDFIPLLKTLFYMAPNEEDQLDLGILKNKLQNTCFTLPSGTLIIVRDPITVLPFGRTTLDSGYKYCYPHDKTISKKQFNHLEFAARIYNARVFGTSVTELRNEYTPYVMRDIVLLEKIMDYVFKFFNDMLLKLPWMKSKRFFSSSYFLLFPNLQSIAYYCFIRYIECQCTLSLIRIPCSSLNTHIRKAYFGGSNRSSICGQIHGIVTLWDVVSHYPSAMTLSPGGDVEILNKKQFLRLVTDNELLAYPLVITCTLNRRDTGCLFDCSKHNIAIWPSMLPPRVRGKCNVTMTSLDILMCINDGWIIDTRLELSAIKWDYWTKIPGKFYKAAFALKKEGADSGDMTRKHIAKILMNSSIGKFTQRPNYMNSRLTKYGNSYIGPYKVQNEPVLSSNRPSQLGIFCLAWSRTFMYAFRNVATKNGLDIIYGDTDSMAISYLGSKKFYSEISHCVGSNLGDITLQSDNAASLRVNIEEEQRGFIGVVARKTYCMYGYPKYKDKIRAKGQQVSSVTKEKLISILCDNEEFHTSRFSVKKTTSHKNECDSLQIKGVVMKRKLQCVIPDNMFQCGKCLLWMYK